MPHQKVGLMGGACWANDGPCSDHKRWGKRQAGSRNMVAQQFSQCGPDKQRQHHLGTY